MTKLTEINGSKYKILQSILIQTNLEKSEGGEKEEERGVRCDIIFTLRAQRRELTRWSEFESGTKEKDDS